MRVLVTGATGFIGSHAVARLRDEGHEVRALVRDEARALGILAPHGLTPADLVVGDMEDARAVTRAVSGCDAVLHSAASVSVTTGATDFESNVGGVECVLGAALAEGVPALYVSSLAAIMSPGIPVDPDGEVAAASTHYGRSKARAERWVRDRQVEGAPFSIVYPSGVVGPDDPGFSESVKAFRSFLRGTLESSGGNQFIDVRDLALLLVRMLERGHVGRVVAAGRFFAWKPFSELLERTTGATVPRIRAPGWLLRPAARGLDLVARVTGKTMPMTGEGIEIATRWEEVADSPAVRELGVEWRPSEETLADMFRWFVEVGKLPPRAVPALRVEAGPSR